MPRTNKKAKNITVKKQVSEETAVVHCDTVGDLLDELAAIAKNPDLDTLMDSSIESNSDVFFGFKIITKTLSDGSRVLNFELF